MSAFGAVGAFGTPVAPTTGMHDTTLLDRYVRAAAVLAGLSALLLMFLGRW